MRGMIEDNEIQMLKDFEFTHQIASHAGGGFNKAIQLRIKGKTGVYEVLNKQKVTGSYDKIEDAVKAYNDIWRE